MTEIRDVHCVWPARAILGEGPLWCARDQAVYWVDIKAPAIHRYSLVNGAQQSWSMPDCIGWLIERRESTHFIAGLRQGFAELTLEPLTINYFGDPEPELSGNRLNDAKADAQGRIWAGSMDDTQQGVSGALYRLDLNRTWQRVDSGYRVTNGPTFSPDGKTLYHTDSLQRTIYRFNVVENGMLANKRVWLTLPDTDGYPDGMTTDAEGCIWVAIWGGGCVRRYDTDGILEREIHLPVSNTTSCVFAGNGLDRLFVTSASLTAEHEPLAGALFEVDPGVRGLSPHQFAG
jgi:xylono-1,5-lactonase